MNTADNRENKKSKYISKPKFSRTKTYANDEDDIIKNEKLILKQKEERDNIRKHNLKVASGETDKTNEVVNDSNSEDEVNNSNKRRKEKKERKNAEKKALGPDPANNTILTNHSSIPDSDTEDN